MNERLVKKMRTMYKLQKEIDELMEMKNKLREELERIIREEKMEDRKFSVGDRSISYVKRTMTQPLTNKYVMEILKRYYKNDERADEIYEYMMQNRRKTTKYQLEIRKKNDKNMMKE